MAGIDSAVELLCLMRRLLPGLEGKKLKKKIKINMTTVKAPQRDRADFRQKLGFETCRRSPALVLCVVTQWGSLAFAAREVQ
jgi:hypothetical protein